MESSFPIAKPPWTYLGKSLESLCRKALLNFSMIEEPSIAVALSGGKDSLTLLFLLQAIAGRGIKPFQIHAIHVAGEFSCGAGVDQDFLKGICKELNVPLTIKELNMPREGLECYTCSRERRKLIFQTAKDLGISVIAFGHHRDDSVQTLLMNLFQKGEFAALLPKIHMVHYGVTIIRPLIYLEEEKIKTFAKQYGFSRFSCQCPIGAGSKRKKTDQLLEQIEIQFPHVRKNLEHGAWLYGSNKASKP